MNTHRNLNRPVHCPRFIQLSVPFLCALLVMSATSCSYFSDYIPREDITYSRLQFTQSRIEDYVLENGTLPDGAAALPVLAHRDCSMKDGWGRNFYWESSDSNAVRVWSLGKDGVKGGTGEDEDLEIVVKLDELDLDELRETQEIMDELEKALPDIRSSSALRDS